MIEARPLLYDVLINKLTTNKDNMKHFVNMRFFSWKCESGCAKNIANTKNVESSKLLVDFLDLNSRYQR